MTRHRDFQSAFATAMRGGDPQALAPFVEDPAQLNRFAVYRNAFIKGAVDALAAAFPSVRAALGRDAFGRAAAAFVAERPPSARTLSAYGDGFADFLTTDRSDADAAVIRDLARLDRAWLETHHAADDPALSADDLTGVDPDAILGLRPGLDAAVRLVPLGAVDLAQWAALRAAGETDAPPRPIASAHIRPAAALLRRPEGAVIWREVDFGEAAFLSAIAAGATLGDAAEA
ncbi:MAG: DNA-binding domain-containing protein, partial [Pseudomonadota bacterium]